MYSYFTFLDLVKAISVHRAHRLLSESTLILRTLRKRVISGYKISPSKKTKRLAASTVSIRQALNC
jgi:hypothetical protein